MKNIKYIALSLFAGAAITSCSTSKTLVSSGEYDDMYGTSSDAPVAYAPSVSNSNAYAPEYLSEYNDAYDRVPVETSVVGESVEGTDTYFDENYVSANALKRAHTPDAGYTSGYAEGYAEGWNDYAWSGSRNLNSWNSFNNPFGGYGYNSFGYSPFGFSPFNSGFGSYLGMGSMAYGGFYGINSFGFGGMNSFGYSPFGYNSFGYSPWGYSSFGRYSAYGGGFGSPYYGVQPVLANDSRASGNRSYGPRSSGRASSMYNDGFTNTRKPVTSTSSVRRGTVASSRSAAASNARTYTTASSRPASYDAYSRNAARSVSSTRNTANSGLSRSSASPRSSSANTYSRTATRARSYTPSTNSGTSRNSGYSRSSTPTRSNSGYSRPATSTRSSSSAGSYSRGSSSSSSSSRSSSSSARPR
ncbi:hypothetical protein [uncultured Arcticibacterium sp.]|uniref:hypothetical protein n=1 Tax=uncultured Arcticibacterium sp. TaxID=2173042 RepID=UPI0030FA6243